MERSCSSVQQAEDPHFHPTHQKSVFPKCCLSEWSQSMRQSSGLPRPRAAARVCGPLHPKATPAQQADPPSRPNPEWRAAPVSRSSKRAGLEGSDLFSSFVNPWHTQKSRFGCRTEENKGKGGKQRKRWKMGCHDNMDATKGPRHICSSVTWSGGAQHVSAGLEQRGDIAGHTAVGKAVLLAASAKGDFHPPLQSLRQLLACVSPSAPTVPLSYPSSALGPASEGVKHSVCCFPG